MQIDCLIDLNADMKGQKAMLQKHLNLYFEPIYCSAEFNQEFLFTSL